MTENDRKEPEEIEDDVLDQADSSAGYALDRAFIKSWSTSGDADDRPTADVTFNYNKIKS
ncbi:MAG: hypothetical protein AAGE80_04080 [Pseudomonadota bacterium]